MKPLLAKLPNETLIPILNDVLRTYIHAFIMLPPGYPCWHAHYALRRVSRRFRSLVDSIWDSAIGQSQSELQKLRMAMLTGDVMKPGNRITPLIGAYSFYVLALQDEVNVDEMTKGLCEDLPILGYFEMLKTANRFQSYLCAINALIPIVVPKDMRKTLSDAVDRDLSRRVIRSMLFAVDFLSKPSTHMVFSRSAEVPGLASLSIGLRFLMDNNKQLRKGIDFRFIIKLEEVLRHYASPLQSEELNAERRELLAPIAPFIDHWFHDSDANWFRKRVLDHAAVYGLKSM